MKSLLQSFFVFLKKNKIPKKEYIVELTKEPLSIYTWVLGFSSILVVLFFLSFLLSVSDHFSVSVPDYGGTLSEGVIGAPRFINPLLAVSETDQVLTELIYNGLVKKNDAGVLEPVLAKSFIISPDNREYHFTLKEGLRFSNKEPLSSADVLFSFQAKKELSLLRDPYSDWASISFESQEGNTFIIRTSGNPKSIADKLTLGIVPKKLWEGVPSESLVDSSLNMNPIGAGPYILHKIAYSNTIPKEVILKRNKYFSVAKPYIPNINIEIFANQLELKDAIINGKIDSTSMQNTSFIDESMKTRLSITEIRSTKNVSLFISPSSKGTALSLALTTLSPNIDRKKIIDTIENGYGIALFDSSALPIGQEEVQNALTKLGYKQNESGALTKAGTPITISIVVKKEEQLLQTAQLLSQELSRFGIASEFKVFDQGLFTDQVQTGGYAFVLGTDTDVPSGYESIIPLYTKILPHLAKNKVHLPESSIATTKSDIFRDIEKWYVETDTVWKWFK